MFYATGYHHHINHDGITFPRIVRKTMLVRRAVDNFRRQTEEHHMRRLRHDREVSAEATPAEVQVQVQLEGPPKPAPSTGEPPDLRSSEDTRIYRPSTTRPPVVSSTASGVSSTTSVGASECGSTAELLPTRPHHKSSKRQNLKDYELHNGSNLESNIQLSAPLIPQNLIKKDFTKITVDADEESASESSMIEINLCPQVMAALAVSLGSMVVGFASGYTSPAFQSMRDNNSTLPFTLSEEEKSWIGGLMPLAALVGGIAGGPLIETAGRRTTILGTAVPFIISWFLIALAQNVPMILAGRAITGFCVGIASLSLPVYLGETVQPEVRGMLGLLPTTLGNIGILLCSVAGKFLDWSTLAMVGGLIPVPFLLFMFFIPETPRWYISKNKPKRAREALKWLRGKNADISAEINEIEKMAMEAEKSADDSSRIKELLSRTSLKAIFITIGLMFFQQMSGINALIFYTVEIFKDAGSTIEENLCAIILGVVNFLSTFVATVLIDRLGRKILLYISSITMTITLITLGSFFYIRESLVKTALANATLVNLMDNDIVKIEKEALLPLATYGWLPLVAFVIFIIGFSIGFGPIPWLMMGEILPAKIRGSAASLATAFNWSCTFLITLTFSDLKYYLGSSGAFWMFGCASLLGLVFVFFLVPETQGQSLENIEKLMAGEKVAPGPRIRRMSSAVNFKCMPSAV